MVTINNMDKLIHSPLLWMTLTLVAYQAGFWLGTPASLGASVGDSLNIRQGGAGALTITGFIDGGTTKTTSLLNETKTFIADSSGTWICIGG